MVGRLTHLKNQKRLLFVIFCMFSFLITNSCNLKTTASNSLSSNTIEVFIAPSGKDPEVVLTKGGSKICRRGFPDDSVYGLDPIETADEDEEADSEQNQQQGTLRTRVVTVDVDENWFQMGLIIVNKSRDHYLIVEQITFVVSAPWGGELLTGRADISSGYCQTDPLYIVPPTPKNAKDSFSGNKYEPFKKDAVNNLTLFVSGVPVPEGPPKRGEDEGSNNNLQEIRSLGQQQSGVPQASEAFILDRLPSYKVEMLMSGYFTDKRRAVIANFTKKVKFSLSSKFF